MFYLDGVAERSAINQSAVLYQVSTDQGATWSTAQRADSGANETADYYFDVAVYGNDIYVVWSDAGNSYGDEMLSMDSVEAIAKTGKEMNLMLSVINGNTGNVRETRAIGTQNADLQPKVSVGNDGTVYIVWISNDVSSENGLISNENQMSICYASSVDDYKVYDIPLPEKKYPLTLDVGMMGTQVYAAVTIDTDGDLDTQEDRELYLVRPVKGAVVSAFTSNNVLDSEPVFGKVVDENCLFWYQDGNLAYTVDGEQIQYVEWYTQTKPVKGAKYPIQLVMKNNGNTVVDTISFISENGDIVDTISGLSLAPGQSKEITWENIKLPEKMTEVYECKVTVAAQGETNLTDNVMDLSVGSPDFVMEAYQDYSSGDNFAAITVDNLGALDSDAILSIYADEEHTEDRNSSGIDTLVYTGWGVELEYAEGNPDSETPPTETPDSEKPSTEIPDSERPEETPGEATYTYEINSDKN